MYLSHFNVIYSHLKGAFIVAYTKKEEKKFPLLTIKWEKEMKWMRINEFPWGVRLMLYNHNGAINTSSSFSTIHIWHYCFTNSLNSFKKYRIVFAGLIFDSFFFGVETKIDARQFHVDKKKFKLKNIYDLASFSFTSYVRLRATRPK